MPRTVYDDSFCTYACAVRLSVAIHVQVACDLLNMRLYRSL